MERNKLPLDELENIGEQIDETKDLLAELLSPLTESEKQLMMITRTQVNALHGVVTHLEYMRDSYIDILNSLEKSL